MCILAQIVTSVRNVPINKIEQCLKIQQGNKLKITPRYKHPWHLHIICIYFFCQIMNLFLTRRAKIRDLTQTQRRLSLFETGVTEWKGSWLFFETLLYSFMDQRIPKGTCSQVLRLNS